MYKSKRGRPARLEKEGGSIEPSGIFYLRFSTLRTTTKKKRSHIHTQPVLRGEPKNGTQEKKYVPTLPLPKGGKEG